MSNLKMRFTAAGDLVVQRRIPQDNDNFREIGRYISQGDGRFANLETLLHRGEFWCGQFCGGSYHRADPEALDDIKAYGFNLTSFANNHTFDYSYGGLIATYDVLREGRLAHAGVGMNLDEAAAPVYIETSNGRIALIAAVSTLVNPSAMAGQQSRRIQGRPGVNGLRVDETLVVTPEQMKAIKDFAKSSKINAEEEILISEGYSIPPKEGQFEMKGLHFVEGPESKFITRPKKEDLDRVKKAIFDAQANADYILVSIHSHELSGDKKENPADFLIEFAHECIDAGAHAVLGHGPHILRPIEIYKNRPIFYSLGDFVLHNESMTIAGEELFKKYGLTSDATMRDLYAARSNNFTRGLMNDKRAHEAVIANFVMENDELVELELMPIEMGFDLPNRWQHGDPRPCFDKGIIERLDELSRPFGTKITVDERGYGHVVLD